MEKTKATGELILNRTFKARMFEMIFSDKKELLKLYNAMNGTHYDDPELLAINRYFITNFFLTFPSK